VGALVALSPLVVGLLYGSAYANASVVFSLSLLAVVPGTIHLLLIMPLVANHAIRKLSVIYTAAIVLETAIDLFFYPKIGLPAAVAGAILASTVTAILADSYAFPGNSVVRDSRIVKMVIAGAVSLVIPFVGLLDDHRWFLCGITISVFLALAWALKALTVAELRQLKGLLDHSAEDRS
jgi:hypothetical protein